MKKKQEEEDKSEREMLAYCRSNGLSIDFGMSRNSMSQYGIRPRKEEGCKSPTVSAKYKKLFEENFRDCPKKNETGSLLNLTKFGCS